MSPTAITLIVMAIVASVAVLGALLTDIFWKE
jgi:hypothetical protein